MQTLILILLALTLAALGLIIFILKNPRKIPPQNSP